MTWSIHRVSLAALDLGAAGRFFGSHLGLGAARRSDDRTITFGTDGRGLRVRKPSAAMALQNGEFLVSTARHLALEVEDLNVVAGRLRQAAIPYVEAPAGDFATCALYTLDPALNVVAFCQKPEETAGPGIQPWEAA